MGSTKRTARPMRTSSPAPTARRYRSLRSPAARPGALTARARIDSRAVWPQKPGPPGFAMASLRTEIVTLARLSLPASLTQLGLMMTGVVDTLMASRLGVEQLAASALANMWQWSWLSLGLGLVMGIDPLISQAHGRGD